MYHKIEWNKKYFGSAQHEMLSRTLFKINRYDKVCPVKSGLPYKAVQQ